MKINEMFDSIQGEGIHAGVPMSFIRLAGCNLNPACNWCDTPYAWSTDGSLDITVADINPRHKWVCLTGGEPLRQQDELAGLILKLKHRDKKIEIESNGSITPPPWAFANLAVGELVPMVDSWVVDIKLASSGNPSSPEVIRAWTEHIRPSDQMKLVVADNNDLEEAESWMQDLPYETCVVISPVSPSEPLWLRMVAKFCIKHDVRFSLQLHKIIWGDERGV